MLKKGFFLKIVGYNLSRSEGAQHAIKTTVLIIRTDRHFVFTFLFCMMSALIGDVLRFFIVCHFLQGFIKSQCAQTGTPLSQKTLLLKQLVSYLAQLLCCSQACVSWPIGEDWVGREGGALKGQEPKQSVSDRGGKCLWGVWENRFVFWALKQVL